MSSELLTNEEYAEKAVEAIEGSIAKWKAIADGAGIDRGRMDCPLCSYFMDNPPGYGPCDSCPVMKKTGNFGCINTPCEAFRGCSIPTKAGTPYGREVGGPVTNPQNWMKAREIAEAEVKFLEELLKEYKPEEHLVGYKVLGYKGCVGASDVFTSAFIPNYDAIPIMVYRPHEWLKPNPGCGPLCVFKTLEAALKFAYHNCIWGRTTIAKCVYVPSDEESIWQVVPGNPVVRFKRDMWELPAGTALASSVKIDTPRRVQHNIHTDMMELGDRV